MNNFIPLLQTLVWPIFVLLLLFWARRHVRQLLDAIRIRIERGDTFEAGTSGVKLTSVVRSEGQGGKGGVSRETGITSIDSEGIYLVHKARRDRSLDSDGQQIYRLRIFLETDPSVSLSRVSKVVYHLHPTFPNPEQEVTDPETQFELVTYAWGQFNLKAEVYLRDRTEPLMLERYLNF